MTDQDETKTSTAPPDPAEDDVEVHRGMASRADDGPQDVGPMPAMRAARIDGEDDDVEGHFGHLKSPSSRGE
jgi:hypothetical protein